MPLNNTIPGQLSPEVFAEFKTQYSEEFPTDKISDAELHARDLGVLRVFDIILQPSGDEIEASIKVTDEESRILAYLHRSVCHAGRSLSVREVPKKNRSTKRFFFFSESDVCLGTELGKQINN